MTHKRQHHNLKENSINSVWGWWAGVHAQVVDFPLESDPEGWRHTKKLIPGCGGGGVDYTNQTKKCLHVYMQICLYAYKLIFVPTLCKSCSQTCMIIYVDVTRLLGTNSNLYSILQVKVL
jgi:hypothetical protein